MRSRRSFLRLTGGAAGAAFATARYGIDEVAALTAQAAAGGRTPALDPQPPRGLGRERRSRLPPGTQRGRRAT